MTHIIRQAKNIVVKIGSELLYNEKENNLCSERLIKLVSDISTLYREGKNIIIVTSGSIALGRKSILKDDNPVEINQLQAAAAVGQAKLIVAYEKILSLYYLPFAQVLYNIEDKDDPKRAYNTKATITELLNNRIIPIINENNTVSQKDVAFKDNDELAAFIASLIQADVLILFTSVKGLYSEDPRRNPDAVLVKVVDEITDDVMALAKDSKSTYGKGGMKTKIEAAKYATGHGCHVFITAITDSKPVQRIITHQEHTHFKPTLPKDENRKQWLMQQSVNQNNRLVITKDAKSKMQKGLGIELDDIISMRGVFRASDLVAISVDNKRPFAKGIILYSADELRDLLKYRCNIESIVGDYIKCDVLQAHDIVFL
ncbi:glutamate 5-kinase [Legionella spiritensis]|uniref:Glutamate 5-kinase n=1 Tax=Legionella spiritensis TaxID=452 RepID=A0A0W0YYP6_LEGSP|nr:glutamate 5-kinase [Legionella spiritensis]KTD61742.1 glutamate 5-kinase [Legionella spiritensis]SNV38658.1 glutamate 5-kinase [Legionella spiritensis]